MRGLCMGHARPDTECSSLYPDLAQFTDPAYVNQSLDLPLFGLEVNYQIGSSGKDA